MGILDDAIREHLDLKRRHGVPEEELQRQEDEALGPARRDVAQRHEDGDSAAGDAGTADADETAEPAADQETVLFDMEDATVADTPPSEDAATGAEPTPVEPAPVEPPPVESEPAPDVHGAEDEDELEADEELDADEEPEADEELDADEEEGLLSAEEESAAESGDPDVLEDTPDFLQETPEHDRLWFEQKPPRDFDFD